MPFVAGTLSARFAVNLSPTALVFVHTFEFDVNVKVVPAATVPTKGSAGLGEASTGPTTGGGVAAGGGVTAAVFCGAGLGFGFGVTTGTAGFGSSTGFGGGVTAVSCNIGLTVVSREAMARSRPNVLSAESAVSEDFFSPHAETASAAALSMTSIAREGRIYSRIQNSLIM